MTLRALSSYVLVIFQQMEITVPRNHSVYEKHAKRISLGCQVELVVGHGMIQGEHLFSC